jgi:ElaB/YqjD/DUF883 family membrane-anchored ribosome-binding protein
MLLTLTRKSIVGRISARPKGTMPRRNGFGELSEFQETKAQLIEDLKLVAEDAEELIKATGGELSGKTREIRERLKVVLEDAREACGRLEDQAAAGLRATDRVIRDNPYRSIGIAVGAGFLIGYLLKRRS